VQIEKGLSAEFPENGNIAKTGDLRQFLAKVAISLDAKTPQKCNEPHILRAFCDSVTSYLRLSERSEL